jgi:hypothetical protein
MAPTTAPQSTGPWIKGTRVQYSPYALRAPWDYYLAQGEWTRKAAARDAYDQQAAMRGTVTHAATNDHGVAWYGVTWDNGTTSQTAPYRLARIEARS